VTELRLSLLSPHRGQTVNSVHGVDLDAHLNVFLPYARPANHEDQLTRAALVVMKLVPLAHEAFLGLISCQRLAELPPPRYDLQTGQLTASEDAEEVKEFVSVLLRPHKEVTGIGKVEASDRRAVYDGVIQYGATLLVCIESKLLATASGQQARKINAKKLQWKKDRLIHVRWEQLLDRWLNLLALGVLGAAETQVLDDFFDVAERHFGDLLPFNTLERCGTNMRRRLRRLRVLLEDATGLVVPLRRDGVTAKFAPGTVVTTQQATLWADDEAVHLGIWPAELAAQYNALFDDPARRKGLLDLAGRPGWTCTPNMHVAFRFATGPQRWYPRKQKQLPLATYFDQWTADLGHHGAGMRTKAQLKSAAFRKWILDRGYADEADMADLRVWLDTKKPTTKFQIRPGMELKRSWPIKDATELDRSGDLLKEVHSAIDDALTALNEPTLKPIDGHTR